MEESAASDCRMLTPDESRIMSKIRASQDFQYLRQQIDKAEAELAQANQALSQLPTSILTDLLSKQEEALEALYQEEKELLAQARKRAERELQAEHVDSLRTEAMPLLGRAVNNLEFVRESLRKVVNIEAEARANGGSVMSESIDVSSIDFFVPQLIYQPDRGTWLLKRA